MPAMLNQEIVNIIVHSRKHGWVLEPDAKHIFKLAGLDVPNYTLAKTLDAAVGFANKCRYPVVAKVVSPEIVHKSDVGGVVLGINTDRMLSETFERFSSFKGFQGMLVEEALSGFELIVGAKIDHQFGPVVLLGIGGTGVEIYRDTALRMLPLKPQDVTSMVKGLKGHQLLEGYRGAEPVDMQQLTHMLMAFSGLVMQIEPYIESIDLNPVICTAERCVVADARMILKG
jgi:acyl-CoA synthetase (NDP forming)